MIVDGVKKGVEVLSTFARAILDPRTQKFVEAGFLSKDLEITKAGEDAIHAIAGQEWAEKLEAVADRIIADKKKAK